jgi:RNA polymerase sigma-70 factor (ECF subfamily)
MEEARPALAAHAPSDDTLMALAQSGDVHAFAALIERHQAAVRRICSLILFDRESSRDAAQEVFLRLWKTRARYRSEGKLKPLLLTIARNYCRRLRYQRKLETLLLSGFETAREPERLPGDAQRLVQRALHDLPEKFRVPLVLRFVEELDYADIAAVIGRTESATRSRIHYGLKALGALLPKEIWP